MQHIKNLLSQRVRQSGFSQQVKASLVIEEFSDIINKTFGAKISHKIRPLYIKGKVLTVACLSSVISQEMNFKKNEFIRQINDEFKEEIVREIKLII